MNLDHMTVVTVLNITMIQWCLSLHLSPEKEDLDVLELRSQWYLPLPLRLEKSMDIPKLRAQ